MLRICKGGEVCKWGWGGPDGVEDVVMSGKSVLKGYSH